MTYSSARIFGLSFLTFLFAALYSATAQTDRFSYGFSSAAYVTDGETLPFWLYANQLGRVDQRSSNFINRLYGYYSREDKQSGLRLTAGIDAFGRFSSQDVLSFTQLYGKVAYRGFTVTGGRFDDPIGLNDRDLSMGSMLVSRNAPPVPKIRLATDGFIAIPATGGHLQFSAMLAHGWFADERYIDHPLLHQKYLYFRYARDRFDFTIGGVHNVMWGGTHPQLGAFNTSLSAYWDVLTGSAASGNTNAPINEIQNTVGNSVAAYEAKVDINISSFRLKVYRQFYLEDKVALRFRSPWDGLWGAGFELEDNRGWVTEILWEHLNTKRQNSFDFEPTGRTNYYNNGVYRTGWTYEGRVLGNPLIINGPVANFKGGPYPITNNIIIAHYIGIEGRPSTRWAYKVMFTYSRNYGTHYDQGEEPGPYVPLDELRRDEYSSLFQLHYMVAPEYGLALQTALAWDVGELYEENRWGLQIGLSWNQVVD